MTAAPRSSGNALWTFAIFALAGPAVGAIISFIPNMPNFLRWVSIDSRIWLTLVDSALLIYPLGIWPGLIAGAAVAWRDRTSAGATLPFAIIASLVAGFIWNAGFEFLVLPVRGSLLSEINLLRVCACIFAGAFCWWLSRTRSQPVEV